MAHFQAFFFVLVMAVAMSEAASNVPAHKGKAKLSPVCAASASARKSKSSCTAFEEGICSTVDACPNIVTAADLDAYNTPIFVDVRASVVDGQCQSEVSAQSPADIEFFYDCFADPVGGNTVLDVQSECPEGYIATQSACRNFADLSNIGQPPLFYGVENFARCTITLPGDGSSASVGLWLMCMRAGPIPATQAKAAEGSANSWRGAKP